MKILDRILRAGEGRKVKALSGLVPDINALEDDYRKLSDAELQAKTGEFKQRLEDGEDLEDLMIEAFATVREAADRVIGQRHYDVQLMGGAALHFGWVAEMRTGEGKTLVSTLPVYLNGLSGKGVHVVTVNDYLATRDAEWMGQIYRWLGLEVGLVLPQQGFDPAHKREQYARDITYGTNNEFGFDYLRDNMAMSLADKVQRGHNYAIVDEVDSILVDEARTPLIISGQVSDAVKLYYKFASIVRGLKRDVDYDVDEEKQMVAPTDSGVEKVEKSLGLDNLYDAVSQNLVHQLQAALKAKELKKRDKDYVIANGEVLIVDEFTGRILEGRRWSEGLHQAVEAKEGVKIKEENQTLATITLQNYFRMYDKLAGMTGTAVTEAAEFGSTYNLQVVPIPTNREVIRVDHGDLIYMTEDAKFEAVADDIAERHATGQPILVGTVSVENSERLARILDKNGIDHEVLNAKQHFREAEIITQAGRLGAVTVATNMAGRGVDILLGGNPEGLAERDVKAEGLDPEDDAEGAERYAKRLAYWEAECAAEREEVLELGGLYVLGTERHESRRIDNQLRGRAGRQGDPGESRFYLSLEDELMRLFASGPVSRIMDRAFPDDVPLEAKMVTKAIERAQNTVETRNAEIRKNVLKYDEVMNNQRKVIYERRDQILGDADLREEGLQILAETVERMISTFCAADFPEDWDLEGLVTEADTYWPTNITAEDLTGITDTDDLYAKLMGEATGHFEEREEAFGAEAMREVERQVMLQIIDSKWRDHLYDMDYLQEGIHLRGLGQKNPLVEWQREGFAMFGELMDSIADDYLRYLMRVQVVVSEPRKQTPAEMEYSSSETAVGSDAVLKQAARLQAAQTGQAPPPEAAEEVVNTPVVKSEWDKTGRNEPCPCGSGRKFKQCHGAA